MPRKTFSSDCLNTDNRHKVTFKLESSATRLEKRWQKVCVKHWNLKRRAILRRQVFSSFRNFQEQNGIERIYPISDWIHRKVQHAEKFNRHYQELQKYHAEQDVQRKQRECQERETIVAEVTKQLQGQNV